MEKYQIFKMFIAISYILWASIRFQLQICDSPPNSTPRRFPSYLLYPLLLYFQFIFYLPRCTLLDFLCFFPGFLPIFILLSSNNNMVNLNFSAIKNFCFNHIYYKTKKPRLTLYNIWYVFNQGHVNTWHILGT